MEHGGRIGAAVLASQRPTDHPDGAQRREFGRDGVSIEPLHLTSQRPLDAKTGAGGALAGFFHQEQVSFATRRRLRTEGCSGHLVRERLQHLHGVL